MLAPRIIRQLEEIVGKEQVTCDPTDMLCYSYDATQQSFLPDAVVFPADTAQISAIVRLANREQVPLFPRGAGSGFSGGALPTRGGIVLVTTRLDRIVEIDQDN
ncbi:MAG: FAD-binding protein, partial [Desulfuromonas thiophila]|nr:FAD-binding protein [Desulfuromonas thiophila]